MELAKANAEPYRSSVSRGCMSKRSVRGREIGGDGSLPALIDDFPKPRFLPTIRPTQFNYPVDILGKWLGTKYRFVQSYRSGFPENLGEEFDAPFARLDWISRNRFDIQWHRHTLESGSAGIAASPSTKRLTP
ncbi:hypothetical protein QA641_37195 [Bradyrhizobium sp. CB1650]|uniref:DUF3024 domain-containing protein n=1 Tax=Bradyrhizobium sp. CB1650 TaxID=3039153 RepID=UPI002435CB09|nr:hypothetical protein [Bradyrhizobium sp. CB1650]WGD51112.1 hypothetical protein QA641_37195 [Bradyrhizobium sp. CB1650]